MKPWSHQPKRNSAVCASPGHPVRCGDAELPRQSDQTEAGRSSKAQWLRPTPGLRDWTTQLAEPDIAAIEVAVGELLGEFGYAPGGSPATSALRAHVGEVRSAFTANLRADDRPIPRSW